MVRYGAVVVEAWIWHRSKPSRIKAEDSSEMIDTSPTSRLRKNHRDMISARCELTG
jgi:hypothetical protein